MELVGEKRIQALFSEQRLADEQTTPSFVGAWPRAQSKTFRPQRAFNLSFVAATALLVCALVSLALWSRHLQGTQNPAAYSAGNVPPVKTTGPVKAASAVKDPEPKRWPADEQRRLSARARALKSVARRQSLLLAANRKAAREAKTLASWESPTAKLLDSPSDELLKTLPQLNQTVDELKSFLPSSPK